MEAQEQYLQQDANKIAQKTIYTILFTISFTHLINDLIQSVIPSLYPLIKQNFNLTYAQIGLITLTYQLTASILQPFIGSYTDKKPKPFSLVIGMSSTTVGLILLAFSNTFAQLLLSVSFVGIGSSIFHPESSRVAHMASGGKKGLAQSIFQLGGNTGSAIGPLLAALIVIPHGQTHILWFTVIGVMGLIILTKIGKWYNNHLYLKKQTAKPIHDGSLKLSKGRITSALIILLVLIFSKYFYMASLTSYLTFFLIEKFNVSVQESQMYLFLFLAAIAIGTIIGGPLGDRFGRKYIIWISILGAAPFTLLLPHVNLFWTAALSLVIGVIIASAFSAILVYATDLLPGKVGMIAGLFFGFAFGMGGVGSALLGWLADKTDIFYVFNICSFLPLLGIITGFLPNIEPKKAQ
ncbi:major facilitator superfamily MFS_1 [Pseudopedobacter saltans DSM 12145]|uniref:Major facilitator superfamily MFS_1 n=1 Tax=Pseudopedobacter saltans (strain ATCC 51119 / DSM 12145 / JCM 21818 / CCUG 39354 / LMG 10337 / NBRC 100064 / NCIMB 13643) TaxID=762903 RepID=F0S925_PSESL|nr:MFS transporter [Pseudopedobacter saltans]ADY51323.1 major facilitator superfamily MFS_1 [Pseudopedobacter saltans DSM 12145]